MRIFLISPPSYQRDALCCYLMNLFPSHQFCGVSEEAAAEHIDQDFYIEGGLMISTQALPLLEARLRTSLVDHLILSPMASSETLISSLRQLLNGAESTSFPAIPLSAPEIPPHLELEYKLTPKQWQVLALLLEAESAKQIAKKLRLSLSTIKTYTSAIFRVFRVRTRMELILATEREGIRFIASQHSLMQTRTYQ